MTTRRLGLYLVIAVIVTAIVLALTAHIDVTVAAPAKHTRKVDARVPQCAEDAGFLRGKGDYANGVWTRYQCVHDERFDGRGR